MHTRQQFHHTCDLMWGCERIRKNQHTCCSAPEMQKNICHFQGAFIQVTYLDVVIEPTALFQTPRVCTHSLSCWQTPHHHTSVQCCNKDDQYSLKKIYELAAKFLQPISRKVPVYHTTMLTAKRYPQKMKSRIQMKGNTQQIKEAAYVFLTKLKINGHKQRAQGAMHGLFVCGISWQYCINLRVNEIHQGALGCSLLVVNQLLFIISHWCCYWKCIQLIFKQSTFCAQVANNWLNGEIAYPEDLHLSNSTSSHIIMLCNTIVKGLN